MRPHGSDQGGAVIDKHLNTNVALLAVAAPLVGVSQSFATVVVALTTYSAMVGALFVLAVAQLTGFRSTSQRLLDVPAAVIALWTGVTSIAFVGQGVRWLSLSGALGLAACGLAGLAVQQRVGFVLRAAPEGA